ncbi:hypothetical protein EKO27_g11534 [Xylaria grammica]|uniref:Protein kinase domain-containing protein n=1 Tax=Xylaria grammica TaxID=363999 RepID=A0A439CN43_9PEZI|nr:hypothetical protein EKO27_g11534 [Xylaria grammica]
MWGGPGESRGDDAAEKERSEHLERHVRTHTKEKPFICHCGAAFTRRDLLTRHERIVGHDPVSITGLSDYDGQPGGSPEAAESEAASLSSMRTNQWAQKPPYIANQPLLCYSNDSNSSFTQPILGQSIFGHKEQEHIVGFDRFGEFTNFLDGVGLPLEWSPYFDEADVGHEVADQVREGSATPPVQGTTRPSTPFNSWLPSAPEKSGLPQNLPEAEPRGVASELPTFRVSEEQRQHLTQQLNTFEHISTSSFKLPSRHSMTRYISSYFEGFHLHLPFMHLSTWRICDYPPELVLAIATIGAQYCFEHRASEKLFHAGKGVVIEKLKRAGAGSFIGLENLPSKSSSAPTWMSHDDVLGSWSLVDAVRTLIILMSYATWEPGESQLREAFALQGLLVQLLRRVGLEEGEQLHHDFDSMAPQEAWALWLSQESTRRAKLIAFTFLHIHSVAYNVYPVLRSNELRLRLPCSTKEWKASSPGQWVAARQEIVKEQLDFQQALALLLRNNDGTASLDPLPTPLDHTASLPGEEVCKLERALRSWTTGWQQAPESTLDPKNENGPIPFTSSSLLGLAYVRIYLNIGPYRQLDTRDPARVASALARSPPLKRSDGVISALLYAAHALSIPVRLGIDRVARSQAFFWSVRHSLSGLECAVLLSKWLRELNNSSTEPLSGSEERILHWVRCIVEEAYATVDFDGDQSEFHGEDLLHLSLSVLKIWGHFFRSNTQWPFINMIGFQSAEITIQHRGPRIKITPPSMNHRCHDSKASGMGATAAFRPYTEKPAPEGRGLANGQNFHRNVNLKCEQGGQSQPVKLSDLVYTHPKQSPLDSRAKPHPNQLRGMPPCRMPRSWLGVLCLRTSTCSFSSSLILSPTTTTPFAGLFSGQVRQYNYPKVHYRAMSSDGKSQPITYNFIEDVQDVSKYRPGGFHPTYIGDTLKDRRYCIVHKLGYGSYATIWLALDTLHRQYVAIKICSANASEDSVEEQILHHLSNTKQESLPTHPGKHLVQSLVDVFDLRGPNGHHKCLVMPPAMMTVDFVHGKGIVHGDIHMGNVFFRLPHDINNLTPEEIYQTYGKPGLEQVVRVDGNPVGDGVPSHLVVPIWIGKSSEDIETSEAEVLLSDFGESFMPASVERFYSNSPLSFRPPESRFPSKPIDFAADIWSLACLAWEILGARPLFESSMVTDDEVLADVVDLLGKPPPEWWTKWDARSEFYTEDGESGIKLAPERLPGTVRWGWNERLELCIQRPRREAGFDRVSENEWTSLLAMLQSMMHFEPDQRATAKRLLRSHWMKHWAVCKTNFR